MKMAEFLELSDDEKVHVMEAAHEAAGDKVDKPWEKTTEDKGECVYCQGEVDAGNYCFGCHRLVCSDCNVIEPHLSECLDK